MRKALAVLLLLLTSGSAFGVQNASAWIKYTSKEGHYSVLLPSQPTVGSQEATSSDGAKFTQYKAVVVSEDVAYLIGYFDYTAGTTFTFDRARDGMVAGVNGTLMSERSISLGAYPGREMRMNAKDEAGIEYDMRARFYDVDRRIYVLQFIGPKSGDVGVADVKAAKYFDSFQVGKPSQN